MKPPKGISRSVWEVKKASHILRFGSEMQKENTRSKLRRLKSVDEDCFNCKLFLPNIGNEKIGCYGRKGIICIFYQKNN